MLLPLFEILQRFLKVDIVKFADDFDLIIVGALGTDDVCNDDLGELAVGICDLLDEVREVCLHLLG